RVWHRMPYCFVAMRQTVVNTFAHDLEKVVLHIARDVAPQNVSAQRQRQTRLAFPPFAEIDNLMEAGLRISELTFVNDQAAIRLTFSDSIEDLIERHHDIVEIGSEK